jgi:putative nucleotidyltransferase with HDIG domain
MYTLTDDEKKDLKAVVDSSSPLMTRFRDKAPGSYKHCQNVSTLCENVAIALGLDQDLLAAAGMLHDIGKMYNPEYFTENQDETNPHDGMEAFLSYQIITRHVSDTALVLTQLPEIPQKVIEVCSEHHGDTVLVPFYLKQKEKTNGGTVEDRFRYKSRKPTTTEASILMIVDCIEATAKSLFNTNKLENVKEMVDKTITRLEDDEQLDELKIGIKRIIKQVIYKEIENTYHKRVSYEDLEKESEKNEN